MAASLLLLASNADGGGGGGGLVQIAIFAVFGLALYFLLIRPQRKRQQEQEELVEKLEVGQDVVTIGGLHGNIVDVSEEFVDLQVDQDGTVLRYQRQSVASITTDDETTDDDSGSDGDDGSDEDDES